MADAREKKISRKRKLNTPNKEERKAKSPKKNRSDGSQVAANDEEDFPRGGANPLTPLEFRQAKNEAEKDILFGAPTPPGKVKMKLKKKRQSVGDSKSPALKESFSSISTDIYVESLTFKKLSKGVLLLGVVEGVFEFEIVISLANNLSGCVHITDINPVFTSLLEQEEEGDENDEPKDVTSRLQNYFPVGMLLKCVVVSTDSSKHGYNKIKLSINPEDINSSLTAHSICSNMVMTGYVSSTEDHGYAICLGVKGIQGFLPKKNVTENLHAGQILDCVVTSTTSDKRMAQLEIDMKKCRSMLTTQKEKIMFSGLLPGMLVKATVKQVNSHGVVVSFLAGFDGCIDLLHLAKHGGSGDFEKTYAIKTKIVCRITYICPSTKTVGLSNLEHLVDGESFHSSSFNIGDIIEEADVLRLDQSKGLLLQLNDELSGYAHISRLSDENMTKIDKKFKAGTKHSCRILGFNSMVGLALVTLEKSVLQQAFIRYHDIKPGVVVSGKIQSLLKSGMLVALSDHIRGFCPSLHYADVTLQHPEKKLHEGKTVKCRVLEVDAERKRLRLTHKKTLVNSEFPVITNLAQVELGMKTHGFITSIRDYGCIVHFYNNIHGLVPKAELGLKSSEDPRNAFYIGQVVTCVVMSCSPVKQKLSLSFNMSAVPSSSSSGALAPGTLVDVDVVGRTQSGLDVQIKPSNTPAFLPLGHLSDYISNCGSLLDIFSPGKNSELTSLSHILCYGRGKDKSLIVSRKQSLIKTASEDSLIKQFDDLEVGQILPGFTRQMMPYGVFVEFSRNIYGLAPNSLLSNDYIADAAEHFEVGQSVMAKITEIDRERRRLLVSLKSCDCYPDQSEETKDKKDKRRVDLLVDFIKERDEVLQGLRRKSKDTRTFIDILPGSIVPGKVSAIKNSGITFLLENGVEGFALPQLTRGANIAVDEVLDAFVLDYDLVNKRVDLTVDSNLVRKRKEIKSKNKKKLNIGEVVSAVVQIIHREYLVMILPNHGLRLAYVPVKETLNDVRDPTSRFKIGQSCEATVQKYVRSKLDKREYLILSVDVSEERVENAKPGAIVNALITSIKGVQINVQFCGKKYKGRVCINEIADNVNEGENPLAAYSRGEKIQVKILGFRDSVKHNFLPITHPGFSKAYAELSARPSRLREDEDDNSIERKSFEKKLEDYKEGDKIFCFVKTVHDNDIWLVVSTSLNGRVTIVDVSTDLGVLKDLTSHFQIGSGHHCTVLKVNQEQKSLDLSMSDCEIKKGNVVPGKVTKILPNRGFAVHLPGKKHGTVFMTDICDDFKENPAEDYQVNQLISCYVLAVNKDGHADLSTRASRTEGVTSEEKIDKDIQSLNDIEEGHIVRGYVKSVTDVGVFVSLSRSIVARVQIKNLSHFFVKNWKPLFPLGKLVKGKVLSIDPNNNRIELSLKGKDVGDKDPAPKPERREKKSTSGKRQHSENNDGELSQSDDEGEKILKKLRKDNGDEDDDESIGGPVEEDEVPNVSSEDSDTEENDNEEEKPTLKIPGGFNWHSVNEADGVAAEDGTADTDDETSEGEENAQVARKKSKRAKRAAKKAEEEFLYKTEKALLDKEQGPQTAEDFDRILLSTPNDSLLWLQYMAYYLHLTEIDKARAVAERALKSISFREESEKFNVWIALLNLENSYGTQDSLVQVFQRALEQNEPKKVFRQLVNIYVGSNKFEQVEQLYQTMIKRFKSSKKVWIDYASYLMERGELDSARNLLQRSFKSLEKRKHVETISRFAMLEFKHGEPERGKTLLDNVLITYPKRTDIWSMYVDVLTKNGDVVSARRLFDKALACKLSSKKTKFIFKKYLEFEKKHGDESSIESVKKMAEEYVRDKATD